MSQKYQLIPKEPLTRAFIIEILCLLFVAPLFYFSTRFPPWILYLSLTLLGITWLWRRWHLGVWYEPISARWPLFFLFFVLLPIAIWAAPPSLRTQYSIPKALILIWNFCLFWTILSYSSRSTRCLQLSIVGFIGSGLFIAILAPLGTNWLYKFPGASAILSAIPSPLIGLFQGASSGFHPNQVGGTLLYVLPLLIAITGYKLVGSVGAVCNRTISITRGRAVTNRTYQIINFGSIPLWLFMIATLFMGLSLLATQSRSSLVGFMGSLVVMWLVPWRLGRWLLGIGMVLGIAALAFLPIFDLIELLSDAPAVEAVGGLATVQNFRLQVWTQALQGLNDFAFTGMGLGTFRSLVWTFYPIDVTPRMIGLPNNDIGHAHNFFLQTGLDFGVGGLIVLLLLHFYLLMAWIKVWQHGERSSLVIGLLGCLVASSIYGLFDAVAMGAKTNFIFWYLFALVFGLASHVERNTDTHGRVHGFE